MLYLLYNLPMLNEGETPPAGAGPGKILTRDFAFLFVSSFLCLGSLYTLIPVLPLYMADVAEATTTQVGLLIGVLTFASFLLRPYIGARSDTLGRKPFLLAGCAIFAVAPLLYLPARALWSLPPVLAFNGAGIACFHTASLTFIGDIAPGSGRGRSQAWFQSSFNLSIMAAPPLAVFIMNAFGYNWVFAAAAAMGAASLAFSIPIREHRIPRGAPALRRRIADLRRPILLVSVTVFACTATLGIIEAFLGLFAESAGIRSFAVFFTVSGAVLITLRFAAGGIIDRLGRRPTVVLALLVIAAGMALLAAARGPLLLCSAAALWGAGFAFCPPALSAMLIDAAPPGELGSAFGAYTMAFEGGIVFGATAMAPVVSGLGYRYGFALTGGLCVLGAAFFLAAYNRLFGAPAAPGSAGLS